MNQAWTITRAAAISAGLAATLAPAHAVTLTPSCATDAALCVLQAGDASISIGRGKSHAAWYDTYDSPNSPPPGVRGDGYGLLWNETGLSSLDVERSGNTLVLSFVPTLHLHAYAEWGPGKYGFAGDSLYTYLPDFAFSVEGWQVDSLTIVSEGSLSREGLGGAYVHAAPGTQELVYPADPDPARTQRDFRYRLELAGASTGLQEYDLRAYVGWDPARPYEAPYSYGASSLDLKKVTLYAHLSPVPEPSAMALVLAGAGLMAVARRRRR